MLKRLSWNFMGDFHLIQLSLYVMCIMRLEKFLRFGWWFPGMDFNSLLSVCTLEISQNWFHVWLNRYGWYGWFASHTAPPLCDVQNEIEETSWVWLGWRCFLRLAWWFACMNFNSIKAFYLEIFTELVLCDG